MAIDTTAERLSVIGHMADMPVLPVGSAIDTTAERLALLQLYAGSVTTVTISIGGVEYRADNRRPHYVTSGARPHYISRGTD